MNRSRTGLSGASSQAGLSLASGRSWTCINSWDAIAAVAHECCPYLISLTDCQRRSDRAWDWPPVAKGNSLRMRVAQRTLVVIFALLAFGLRLYRLDHQPLRGDESFSIQFFAHELD